MSDDVPNKPAECAVHGKKCRSRKLHSHTPFPPHVWYCEKCPVCAKESK